MLDWFRALMPKEDRFFGLFEQHATLVVAGAESLRAAQSAEHTPLQRIAAAPPISSPADADYSPER